MSAANFSSAHAAQLFKAFSDIAAGFDNLAVIEASAVMLAQTIARGSLDPAFDAAGADASVGALTDEVMSRDIALSWPLLIPSKRVRQ